jgi:tetratricopeptide (TPR) repeat protein
MPARDTHQRISQLWQLPLFLLSLGLFGFSAYLLFSPGAHATVDQKIAVARDYLSQDRPDAALEQLNKILDTERLQRDSEAQIHLMMAQALEAAQKQLRISIPANHERIIEQTQLALAQGIKPDGEIHRRLGESFEALGRKVEAVQNYRLAMAMDTSHSLHLQRKVIELELAAQDWPAADASLSDYLKQADLTDAERAWALGERADLLIDQDNYSDARSLLTSALKLTLDPVDEGRFNYQIGYCLWKLNQAPEAERHLRLAREQLRSQHPLDGDASYVLGRIFQDRGDAPTAMAYYEVVVTGHPESAVAPLARLGRGICRIMLDSPDAGLQDLHDLTNEIKRHPASERNRDEAIDGLRQAGTLLSAGANYQGALEAMSYEQELTPTPSGGFFARLGSVLEKRSDQLEASVADAVPTEQIRRGRESRDLRIKAGDAYIAYSRAMTLEDDQGYGDAMWKGISLYDRAGAVQFVISTLELFAAERPNDSLAPDALLRLGNAYQAAGQLDKAITTFQRNRLRYPNSLAASKSAVPLAQAYIAKGPESYARAEEVLRSVVENNKLVTPAAEEFRQSLFELAQLYYRTSRFEPAISRLEELTQRYPQDQRLPQLIFLMADSYRKSAALLDDRVASAATGSGAAADVADAVAARRQRLGQARTLYDHVIELYQSAAPTTDLDKLYFKLSHFYRADCAYDLGGYEEAIRLYDTAAFRFQDDPSALAAYVQIVNAYTALGKPEEAKTANERAKWLLQRMPPEAFQEGNFSMPKEYWQQWLKWAGDSGMW